MIHTTTDSAAPPIAGAWKLHSWEIRYDDGRPSTLPFGASPQGLLIYSADGWMSAVVCRQNRPEFPTDRSPRILNDQVIAESFRSYFHYAGPFRLEGDWVIHSVRHALNPNFVGTEQRRHFSLEEPRLTLRGVDRVKGGDRHHQLVWLRAGA